MFIFLHKDLLHLVILILNYVYTLDNSDQIKYRRITEFRWQDAENVLGCCTAPRFNIIMYCFKTENGSSFTSVTSFSVVHVLSSFSSHVKISSSASS